jgi:hypothetical protein
MRMSSFDMSADARPDDAAQGAIAVARSVLANPSSSKQQTAKAHAVLNERTEDIAKNIAAAQALDRTIGEDTPVSEPAMTDGSRTADSDPSEDPILAQIGKNLGGRHLVATVVGVIKAVGEHPGDPEAVVVLENALKTAIVAESGNLGGADLDSRAKVAAELLAPLIWSANQDARA